MGWTWNATRSGEWLCVIGGHFKNYLEDRLEKLIAVKQKIPEEVKNKKGKNERFLLKIGSPKGTGTKSGQGKPTQTPT